MSAECIYTDTVHSTYLKCLFWLGCIAIPLDICTMLIITLWTPTKMSKYKWYLLIHSIFSSLMDVYLILVAPLFYLPELLMVCTGLFCYFTSMTFWIVGFFFFLKCCSIGGVVFILLYQYRTILPPWHFPKWTSRSTDIGCLGLFTFLICYTAIIGPTMRTRVNNMLGIQKLPCLVSVLESPTSIFFDASDPIVITVFAICVFILPTFGVMGYFLTAHIFSYLRSSDNSMSNKTRDMHIRFMKRLLYQTTLPLFFIISPYTVLLTQSIFKYGTDFQYFGDVLGLMVGSHGIVSSVSILVWNDSYAKKIVGWFSVMLFWKTKKVETIENSLRITEATSGN